MEFCRDFQSGRCHREACKYMHAEPAPIAQPGAGFGGVSDVAGMLGVSGQKAELTLEVLRRIVLTRRAVEAWIGTDDPEVDEVLRGCYVRVLVNKGAQGERTYRLQEVTGRTDAGALLTLYGDQAGPCRIDHISNAFLTQSELSSWLTMMDYCGSAVPTAHAVLDKLRQIKTYIQYCEADLT
eukprot:TRINITY_DN4901_c0_g1_i1.p1 TRINITY_DN4901_c0_g1~~TRINITY_DN4901_c0_g1_i1.p1  ORF type:complete len:182 (+),score=22.27 TRINITY_DN4901_c0_g1_i1:56-601(+)